MTKSHDSYIIEFDKIQRREGSLSVVQGMTDIPFDIKRVYYMTDVPEGSKRGFHAHKELRQVIIPLSGTLGVTLDDGTVKTKFILHRTNEGLYVPPGLWRELNFVSEDTICLVLASERYDENDYIRDYNEFLTYRKCIQ